MGPDLSGLQVVRELGIDKSDASDMITTLRQEIVDRLPPETLSGEAECDEAYILIESLGRGDV